MSYQYWGDTGLSRHKPRIHRDSTVLNRDLPASKRMATVYPELSHRRSDSSRFRHGSRRLLLFSIPGQRDITVARPAVIGRPSWTTVVKPCYIGLHSADTVVEAGKRPGLHRGNYFIVRTRLIFVEEIPRFIKVQVYRLVFTEGSGENLG